MHCRTTQLILWTVTLAVFLELALNSQFDWLIVAVLISSLVWCAVVPRTSSR
jgi:hypothetical protein